MTAYYDSYDYPSYWEGREYEHQSEVHAINEFLKKIPKIKTVLEIGAGYGRLTPIYYYRSAKVILTDPSSKILKIAKNNLQNKKIKYIQSKLENLPNKIRAHSVNLIVLVRVLHHIEDLDFAFSTINNLLTQNGYFLLEYANKRHLKALFSELFHGNLMFLLDIFPKEVKSKKKIKYKLPFRNYNPDLIRERLYKNGFKIIDTRSVSNIRSPFLKKLIPLDLLLLIEKILQKPFSGIYLGPSMFVLVKKVN